VLGCLPAEADNPTRALQMFYQAIAHHDCEKAATLAEGYSVERCQHIASLQLGEKITLLDEQADKAVLQFTVVYQLTTPPEQMTTEATLIIKRIDKQWKVDFSSLKVLPRQDAPVHNEKQSRSRVGWVAAFCNPTYSQVLLGCLVPKLWLIGIYTILITLCKSKSYRFSLKQ
jgi:hypothetical protein